MKNKAVLASILAASTMFAALSHAENSRYNLPEPVTRIAESIFSLHMLMFWICVSIFVVVFGFMFWSIYAHRKSKGHKAEQFHEHVGIEIAWTVIPVLILLGMAWPATKTVLAQKDTTNPDITIKATGYQWKWGYDYIKGEGEGIRFLSTLSTPRAQIDRGEWKGDNYLLEVDNAMVVPVGKKNSCADHGPRRDPRLVGAGARCEAGCDSGLYS